MTRPGLGFTLFGFPVTIDPWFVLVAGLLGWTSGTTPARIATWVGVVLVSVLVHELGHAVVARSRGAKPVLIDLYAFGGITRFSPAGPMTRVETAGVSLAGPSAGLVLGGIVAGVVAVAGMPNAELAEFGVRAAVWVNIGWGLINLLPVLPLDGGHVLTAVLPGDIPTRHQRAAWASVVFGVAAAIVLWRFDLFFGAVLFASFAATNLATARHAPRQSEEAAIHDRGVQALELLAAGESEAIGVLEEVVTSARTSRTRDGFKAALVEHLAMNGDPAQARVELDRLPGQVPASLYALVTVCESGGAQGIDELAEVFCASGDPASARYVVLGFVRADRADQLGSLFRSAVPPARSARSLEAARRAAAAIGANAVLHDLATLA